MALNAEDQARLALQQTLSWLRAKPGRVHRWHHIRPTRRSFPNLNPDDTLGALRNQPGVTVTRDRIGWTVHYQPPTDPPIGGPSTTTPKEGQP